jgi:hypothetical protein
MAGLKQTIESLEKHLKTGKLSESDLTRLSLDAFKDIAERLAALEKNNTPDGELRVGGKPVAGTHFTTTEKK